MKWNTAIPRGICYSTGKAIEHELPAGASSGIFPTRWERKRKGVPPDGICYKQWRKEARKGNEEFQPLFVVDLEHMCYNRWKCGDEERIPRTLQLAWRGHDVEARQQRGENIRPLVNLLA